MGSAASRLHGASALGVESSEFNLHPPYKSAAERSKLQADAKEAVNEPIVEAFDPGETLNLGLDPPHPEPGLGGGVCDCIPPLALQRFTPPVRPAQIRVVRSRVSADVIAMIEASKRVLRGPTHRKVVSDFDDHQVLA